MAHAEMSYFHADHLGSTAVGTDSSGVVQQAEYYTPFGEILRGEERGEGATPYLYTGQEKDSSTDFYYFQARYYDPLLARFVSADPLKDAKNPQDFHLYAYAWNNPLKVIDPSGESEEDPLTLHQILRTEITVGKFDKNLTLMLDPATEPRERDIAQGHVDHLLSARHIYSYEPDPVGVTSQMRERIIQVSDPDLRRDLLRKLERSLGVYLERFTTRYLRVTEKRGRAEVGSVVLAALVGALVSRRLGPPAPLITEGNLVAFVRHFYRFGVPGLAAGGGADAGLSNRKGLYDWKIEYKRRMFGLLDVRQQVIEDLYREEGVQYSSGIQLR
ncbi:MAG: RHS repeat-associated core domain-containing protein [Deltaproteobacteria bacterium]|nr:RHS repeat-associated core domain-containing protein [Deltaproteobacteria bacterium]